MTLDPEDARLYATEKVLAEPRLPTLVPMVVGDDVVIGFLRVNNVLNHFEFEHAVRPDPTYGQRRDASRNALCAVAIRRVSSLAPANQLPPLARCCPKDLL